MVYVNIYICKAIYGVDILIQVGILIIYTSYSSIGGLNIHNQLPGASRGPSCEKQDRSGQQLWCLLHLSCTCLAARLSWPGYPLEIQHSYGESSVCHPLSAGIPGFSQQSIMFQSYVKLPKGQLSSNCIFTCNERQLFSPFAMAVFFRLLRSFCRVGSSIGLNRAHTSGRFRKSCFVGHI